MPEPHDVIDLLGLTGPWALLVLLFFGYLYAPEKFDQAFGKLLKFFSWGSDRLKKRSAQAQIQGDINDFSKDFNRQVKGATLYGVKVHFVKEVDRAELRPNEQQVIVRIKDRAFDDENLVRAMLVFCPYGVIPNARQFIPPVVNEAIDFSMTRKLLTRLKHDSAVHYLNTVALPEACAATSGLASTCQMLDEIDRQGHLTRVLLPELKDLGASAQYRMPNSQHFSDVSGLIEYVHAVSTRAVGQNLGRMAHLGQDIRCAFFTVGLRNRIEKEGIDPYLYHLLRLKEAGVNKAYIEAWGGEYSRSAIRRAGLVASDIIANPIMTSKFNQQTQGEAGSDIGEPSLDDQDGDYVSIRAAKAVTATAHEEGIARVGRMMRYPLPDRRGEVSLRDYILIELILD